MAFDLANFPSDLERGFGAKSAKRDARRLLLSFKQSHSRQEIEELLKNTRLILEDSSDEVSMLTRVFRYFRSFISETSHQREKVQQTPRKFWIRSRNGDPVIQEDIRALEELLGPTLSWIGPVYRSPGSVGRRGLFCPFPTVLLIKPVANVREKALLQKLDEFHLKEIPEKSKYRGYYRYFIIKDPSQYTVYPLQDDLRREPDLIQETHLERMFLLSSAGYIPNDPLYPTQWNMTQISAHLAWDTWKGSSPVVVCVLDTGFDLDHPDLTRSYTNPHTILTDDGSNASIGERQGGLTNACDSHGTRCAGVVAAGYDNGKGVTGLAGNHCQIMPVAFPFETAGMIGEGIKWAADNGAQVISLSYAGDYLIDPSLGDAIKYACQPDLVHNRPGVLICVCTQNDGDSRIRYPATLNDPIDAWVMACGASDSSDNRRPSSNYGDEMSVVAPGVNIPTTTNHHSLMNDWLGCGELGAEGDLDDGSGQLDYYSGFTGTSASTPHVAGLAALLFSTYPYLTNVQVRDIIEQTADYIPSAEFPTLIKPNGSNWNKETGYGRINVFSALQSQTADVMIKDYPGDSGAEPSTPPGGNFWDSSDIVTRATDDGIFLPGDVIQSRNVVRGQDNYLYVRVTNNGLVEARNVTVNVRIVQYVGLQFVYPLDWIATNSTHVSPMAMQASVNIPPPDSTNSNTFIAKFRITSAQVGTLWSWINGMGWHPCILAEVTCDNDLPFASASMSGGNLLTRRNNLAQSNLSVIEVQAGTTTTFPILAGHPHNAESVMEIVVERGLLASGPVLSLDEAPRGIALPGIGQIGSIGEVSVEGGGIFRRENKRFVKMDGPRTIIRMQKSPRQVYAFGLQAFIPPERGRRYVLKVSQRNQDHKTVGGATVVYVVT